METEVGKRLWSRVQVVDECWYWTGYRHASGYGLLTVRGSRVRAHRVAWELTYGPIPPTMHVLHRCDHPPCIRPEHLFLGTNTDNQRDKRDKMRGTLPPIRDERGANNPNSKLHECDVRAIRALASAGVKTGVIADAFGVTHATVSVIVHRKRWTHV